jgi:hypothetical protein
VESLKTGESGFPARSGILPMLGKSVEKLPSIGKTPEMNRKQTKPASLKRIAGKTKTVIAIALAVAGILVLAGKVVVHYARNVRLANAASEISFEHAVARAWLCGQYEDNGVYPRELPARIECDGRPYDLSRRQYLRYEVSERGDRCELSWSFGSCGGKDTMENGN